MFCIKGPDKGLGFRYGTDRPKNKKTQIRTRTLC